MVCELGKGGDRNDEEEQPRAEGKSGKGWEGGVGRIGWVTYSQIIKPTDREEIMEVKTHTYLQMYEKTKDLLKVTKHFVAELIPNIQVSFPPQEGLSLKH